MSKVVPDGLKKSSGQPLQNVFSDNWLNSQW